MTQKFAFSFIMQKIKCNFAPYKFMHARMKFL